MGRCRVASVDRAAFTRLLGPCEEILKERIANYDADDVPNLNTSHF